MAVTLDLKTTPTLVLNVVDNTITLEASTVGLVVALLSGEFSDRPSDPGQFAIYLATDTDKLYAFNPET